MASIFRRSGSPFWQAAFLDGSGRRHYKSTKQHKRSAAIATAAEMERRARKTASADGDEERQRILAIVEDAAAHALRGTLTDSNARQMVSAILETATGRALNNPSVEEWFDLWLEGKRKSRSITTYIRYETVKRQFLEGLPENRRKAPIGAIVPAEILAYHQSMIGGGRTDATANTAVKILRAAFNAARRQGIILTNPAEAVELTPATSAPKDVFTPKQIASLLKVADREWGRLILAGFYTGGRLGDLATLKWSAIDFERGAITFVPSKTNRSIEIPLHPTLRANLETTASHQRKGAVFPSLSKRSVPGKTGLSLAFRALMANAGIEGIHTAAAGAKGHSRSSLSYHSLRHSFNSAMANAGVSQEIRQKLTGHASRAINDQYTHTELEILADAVSSVPSICDESVSIDVPR